MGYLYSLALKMRYKYTKRKQDKETNNRILTTTVYPQIISKNTDLIYYTKFNDSYMKLANTYYKDQSLWWVIAEANNLREGRFALNPNEELRIPINLAPILLEFRELNSGGSPTTGGGGGGY